MRAARGALILVGAALVACTQARGLLITEVGAGRVELYLAEVPTNRLALEGQTLEWRSVDNSGANPPLSGSVPLTDSIAGGKFLVVFELQGHVGGASTASYTNFFNQSSNGLEVAPDSLGPIDPTRSYAYRVSGHNFRYIFPFFFTYDDTDDTVRFGPSPRPNLGGAFAEDGSLEPVDRSPGVGALRAQTLRRHTAQVNTVDTPIDRDRENDWRGDDETYGTAK